MFADGFAWGPDEGNCPAVLSIAQRLDRATHVARLANCSTLSIRVFQAAVTRLPYFYGRSLHCSPSYRQSIAWSALIETELCTAHTCRVACALPASKPSKVA